MRSGAASVFCGISALAILLLGCGSDPLRTDGRNAGSGGHQGAAGAGGGGTSGNDDASAGTGGATGNGGSNGGSGGSNGSGGSSGSGGATGAGGTAGSGGAPGSGGAGGGCGKCQGSLSCCGSQCVDLPRDPRNCGACGNHCPSDKSFCEDGVCKPIPCGDSVYPPHACSAGTTCCGRECCQAGQICCNYAGPVDFPVCHTPTASQPSCPVGCGALGLCMSDRTIKRALEPVDTRQVLDKVRALPIATWQYRSDPSSVRHMGPMAQDFWQAFGLGDSDRVYHGVDGHGVALASIQALAKLAAEQQERINHLQRQNAALERRLRTLEHKP